MDSVFNPSRMQAARSLLNKSSDIVITTHKSPDGDAMGSSLALHHFLIRLGKRSTVIVPDEFPAFLQWLPGHGEVRVHQKEAEECEKAIQNCDLIFSLDYNHLSRTDKLSGILEKASQPFILIDHHQQPDSFPSVAFSDTSACSTAEMIYDFIQALGEQQHLDATVGTCIYTGIMTDSGSFRFPSVSAHTHMIVADLIERGVEHSFIHRHVYDTNLLSRLQLVGYALSERLEMLNSRAAMISLDAATLKRFNHQPGDTEGLVNQALSLKDVNLAVFVREGANEVKLSFRSKGAFDVNAFARKYFNGGGHANAAGGSSNDSFAHVLKRLREILNTLEHELNY